MRKFNHRRHSYRHLFVELERRTLLSVVGPAETPPPALEASAAVSSIPLHLSISNNDLTFGFDSSDLVNAITPTGTIYVQSWVLGDFPPDFRTLQTLSLVDGAGTYHVSTDFNLLYRFRIAYSGDSNYATCISNTVEVDKRNEDTLVISPDGPSQVSVRYSNTVVNGDSSLYNVTSGQIISDGSSWFEVGQLPAGNYLVQARYPGDMNNRPASSNVLALTIPKSAVPLTLSANTNNTQSSSRPSVIVTIDSGSIQPGGSVALYDNNLPLQTTMVPFNARYVAGAYQFEIDLGRIASGRHTLMAAWTGDDFFLPANSNRITLNLAVLPTTQIDVLALYTDSSLQKAGGINYLSNFVSLELEDASQAFSNSGIPVTLNFSGLAHVSYKESGSFQLDLARLSNPADGYLDGATALRNYFGADVVMLIDSQAGLNPSEPSTFTYGISTPFGKLSSPNAERNCFMVVSYDPNGDFVFAHELGHILGAGHAVGDPQDTASASYGHGYRFNDMYGNPVHDVMAYDPGALIPYYATPDATYWGTPVGNTSTSDLTRLFAQTAPVVSAYRSGQVIGGVDSLDQNSISGWACDTGDTNSFLYVRLLIDGKQSQLLAASDDRPDLASTLGSELHGFHGSMPRLSVGNHMLDLVATDSAGNSTFIAHRTLVIPPLLFDESYYLAHNPDVAAAVAAGKTTAWAHFLAAGQYELRNPSAYFDANYYLAHNPDIAAAWAAKKIASPWQHYYTSGQFEKRKASPLFDESYYLSANPDVAQAVAAGIFKNGLTHYLLAGRFENRRAIP